MFFRNRRAWMMGVIAIVLAVWGHCGYQFYQAQSIQTQLQITRMKDAELRLKLRKNTRASVNLDVVTHDVKAAVDSLHGQCVRELHIESVPEGFHVWVK